MNCMRPLLASLSSILMRAGFDWFRMDTWLKKELLPLFPGRSQDGPSLTTPSVQPSQPNSDQAPPAPSSLDPGASPYLSEEAVSAFVKRPHTLVGKKFVHCPPPGEYDGHGDGDSEGAWQPITFLTRFVDGEIDHEFECLLESDGDDPIPMDAGHVEELLRFSKLVDD